MDTIKDNTKNLYFTPRLLKLLEGIWNYPLTIVEAPMGYGKTTAVKHVLNRVEADILWLKVYDNSTDNFWDSFAQLFGELKEGLDRSFVHLGLPSDAVSKREALNLLNDIEFSRKCVLVIDDYHLLDSPEIDHFLTVLIENEIKNLHIVLTQRYTKLYSLEELSLKGLLYHIAQESFELSSKDIMAYYNLCGVLISETQAEYLYSKTEGWISALYLMLLSFLEDGMLEPPDSIYKLIEKIVYGPLSDELKEFSLKLSIFDKFTKHQAAFICGDKNVSKMLIDIVGRNIFISYDSHFKTYQIHSLFRDYLLEIMDSRGTNFKIALHRKAAEWYLQNHEYATARQFWYFCGDFENILLSIEEEKAKTFTQHNMKMLSKYLNECPEEIKSRHHYALLILSIHLILHNEFQMFGRICKAVSENINKDDSLDDMQRRELFGELQILLGIAGFNDLKKMTFHFEKAWQLLGQGTSIFNVDVDWSHGSPSILYLYYRESGKLLENLENLKNGLPCYRKLTHGHSSGGEYVMEAEWHYNTGDFISAEIALNKALYKARPIGQWGIELAAMFLQMRIDWMKGDLEHMFYILEGMRKEMAGRVEYQYLHKVELCEMSMYAQLDQSYKIPESLARPKSGDIRLLHASYGMFNIIYGRVLLINAQYIELLGSAEYFLETASFYPNLLGVIYTYIYMAAANLKIHRDIEALENLKKAMEIAMPDKLYMPFVENCDYIELLVHQLTTWGAYKDEAKQILKLYKVYATGKAKIKEKYFPEDNRELTDREAEIAHLAAEGLTNREIADRLFISTNTVKSALKSVYSKLSISSRVLLKQYFESLNGKI